MPLRQFGIASDGDTAADGVLLRSSREGVVAPNDRQGLEQSDFAKGTVPGSSSDFAKGTVPGSSRGQSPEVLSPEVPSPEVPSG